MTEKDYNPKQKETKAMKKQTVFQKETVQTSGIKPVEKKQEKAKAKAKARGEEATREPEQTEDKVLNATELSKK